MLYQITIAYDFLHKKSKIPPSSQQTYQLLPLWISYHVMSISLNQWIMNYVGSFLVQAFNTQLCPSDLEPHHLKQHI